MSVRVTRKQNQLLKRQLADHDRLDSERQQANLGASLRRVTATRVHFVIVNTGQAAAESIRITFDDDQDPLMSREPIELLPPRAEFTIPAILSAQDPSVFRGTLTWRDPSGSRSTKFAISTNV
jgi:hypothetical protein